jgi:DsbC/DsbD-like thiol-disulfide interchange protein
MKAILLLLVIALTTNLQAQKAKVAWKYASKKVSEGVYDVTLTAAVPAGWHLYSQTTGEGPVATKFTFTKNALLTVEGKVAEKGKLTSVNDKVWGNTQKYYSGTVVFTQRVKLKGKIKTSVTGEIEYMICDDKQCLPPTIEKFVIKLQ